MNQTLTNNGVPGTLNGREVTFETWTQTQELIPIDSAFPEPDPAWIYVDRSSHEHKPMLRNGFNGERVKGYPTLREVRTEPAWCEMCAEVHDEFDHYECVECGETIKPKVRTHVREYIEGARHAVLTYLGDETALELTEGSHDREFHAMVGGHRYLMGRGSTEIRTGEAWVVRIEFYVKKEL